MCDVGEPFNKKKLETWLVGDILSEAIRLRMTKTLSKKEGFGAREPKNQRAGARCGGEYNPRFKMS